MVEPKDHSSHFSLSWPTVFALGGAAIVGGIVLAPYVAPVIGIGDAEVAETALTSMHSLTEGGGIALALNRGLSYIPFIGSSLAEGGYASIAATAITGIGGVLLGNWMSTHHDGEGIDWGKVVKWGGLATSALIALPSILSGISNGLVYMVNELVSNHAMKAMPTGKGLINAIIGSIGVVPYQEPANLGFTGAAVTLPHLLTCGSTLFPLVASFGANKITDKKSGDAKYVARNTKGEPLPEHDRNHAMTKDEIELTEKYNSASPAQKILLKREILDAGYEPDFHADGTVHLYKHEHAASSIAR